MSRKNVTRGEQGPKPVKLVPPLLDWFAKNARDLPWRRTRDGYAIWVSEIMLQQTQVKTVIPYWERWMRELPDVRSLAKAKPEKIHKLWEGLGYYTRVRNMQRAAMQIVEKHGGEFPKRFEDILDLPGIGRYTAGAIASIAFGEARPILDGNVIRVLTRLFAIAGDPREKETNAKLWRLAESLVSATNGCCSELNQSLMELGATVCTPGQPSCLLCPVRTQCVAYRTGRVAELPNMGSRPKATARRFAAFVVEHRGRFLVRQRPAGVVNAHLWEFPNVEINGNRVDAMRLARQEIGVVSADFQELCVLKHSITRYRITLEVFAGRAKSVPKKGRAGTWLSLGQLNALAFASAHRKVLERLLSEQ